MKYIKENLSQICSFMVLSLIFAVCSGYSVYRESFAQHYLLVPFLRWPFFVGEQLFLAAVVLILIGQLWVCIPRKILWGSFLFFIWILVLALSGFRETNLLSFRHAAMFYYMFFALFTFVAFRGVSFFGWKGICAAACLFLLLCLSNAFYFFTWLVFIVLILSSIPQLRSFCFLRTPAVRVIVFSGAFVLLLMGTVRFFDGPRTHLVSMAVSVLFLFCAWLFRQGQRLWSARFWLYFLAAGVFLAGSFLLVDKRNLISLMNTGEVLKQYLVLRQEVVLHADSYVLECLPLRYYHQEKNPSKEQSGLLPVDDKRCQKDRVERINIPAGSDKPYSSLVSAQEDSLKSFLAGKTADAVFRLLIWADLWDELSQDMRWLTGVGFGKPLRSKALEMFGFGEGEWRRDGWIEPHNSFLHVFYRAGMLGVLIIGVVFWLLLCAIRSFLRLNSWRGILLTSTILYWLTAANFVLVFELPYYAIPFWSLFGIVLAYRCKCQKAFIAGSTGNDGREVVR